MRIDGNCGAKNWEESRRSEMPTVGNRVCLLSIFFIGLQFVACSSGPLLPSPIGDVPNDLRVDRGLNPDGQDEYVRFRTTYYFRVMDSCRVQDGRAGNPYKTHLGVFQVRNSGKFKVVSDSLYRFKMTGKANALFSTIHFESGVLRAEQIDPFGSTVKYDGDAGGYRIESANVIRKRAEREEVYKEIDRLLKLKNETLENETDLQGKVKDLLKDQIALLGDREPPMRPLTKTPTPSQGAEGGGDEERPEVLDERNALCPDGRPVRSSYFLYGPEGVKELDPEDRLLMAMSTDSKPLTSMLQQLSNRHLAQGGNASLQQTVGEEQGRIAGSFRKVVEARTDMAEDATSEQKQKALQNLLKNMIEKFDQNPASALQEKAKKAAGQATDTTSTETSNSQPSTGEAREEGGA